MPETVKVLLAEDETFLGEVLIDVLQKSGFIVSLSSNGNDAWNAYLSFRPDICVLDINMPGRDGFELAEDIRKHDRQIPIIFLTARSMAGDLIKGFELGANDYIKKPFSVEELIVRIYARLNRFTGDEGDSSVMKFGDCSFDTVTQILKIGADEFQLTGKESDLLQLLVSGKNNLLTKKSIQLSVWGSDSFMNSRTLDVYVSKLRKYFNQSANVKIMNARGIGYKLLVSAG
jgi:DNA-binding response OmpR family regulator